MSHEVDVQLTLSRYARADSKREHLPLALGAGLDYNLTAPCYLFISNMVVTMPFPAVVLSPDAKLQFSISLTARLMGE